MLTMKWLTQECQAIFQKGFQKLLISLGQCDLCGNNLHEINLTTQSLICPSCLDDLPLFKQDFIQGDLLNWPAINRALPMHQFDHLFCLSPYLPPFTQWIPQLKYQGRFELASLFAYLLYRQLQSNNFPQDLMPVNLVLSVPLHIHKWKIRGYNQAHILAKPLAKKLQLPYDESLLIRTTNNPSQVGQTGNQRRQNLANAFSLTKALPKSIKHVMLVDDVLTTGSTVNEVSKLLKHAGVSKVTVTTICLTLPT